MLKFLNDIECSVLSSIAQAYGLPDWKIIYYHERNAAFRRLRPDPNVIYPGDEVFVPDVRKRVEQRTTDQHHSFKLKSSPVLLRIVLLDEEHRPLGKTAYKLEIAETVIEDQTDTDGLLEQKIQPGTDRARLSVKVTRNGDETGYTWDLRMGSLDPETQMTGVQARLNNLGYNTGPVDGAQGPRTTDAVKQFQAKYELSVDGVVGPITRRKLVEVHGC